MSDRAYHTIAIASTASASGAAKLFGKKAVGLILPTGAGTFATNTDRIYFYVSVDGTNYETLCDSAGAARSITVAVANTVGAVDLDPDWFRAWPFIKVATHRDDTGAAVAQSAEKSFTLIAE